jgi:DNA repair protein RAD16
MGRLRKRSPSCRRSAQALRNASSIPSTSDVDDVSLHQSHEGPVTLPASRRLLKEVAIPAVVPSKFQALRQIARTRGSPTSSRSSMASPSGPRTSSVEYETPGTSAVPTPSTTLFSKTRRSSRNAIAGRSGKRKRQATPASEDGAVSSVAADARLARELQEEEYMGNSSFSSYKRARTGRATRNGTGYEEDEEEVDDTEEADALTDLSDLESVYSIPQDLPSIGKPRPKTVEKSIQTTQRRLPVRAAKVGAQNAIAANDDNSDHLSPVTSDADDDFGDNESTFSEARASTVPEVDGVIHLIDGTDSDDEADEAFPALSSRAGRTLSIRGRRYHLENLHEHIERRRRDRKQRERARLEKAHPEITTMWEVLAKTPIIPRVPAPQPDSISRKLKGFQLEGLNWMIKQEQTHYRGGLLGDEMGMGKTIQAVSLIMSDFPAKNPTLVIVPPVALLQWSKEIDDYTNGKLKVLVFHGQKSKGYSVKDLKQYNVIMISYQSLESLYRKETKGWTRGDNIVKEDSPMHAIHFHRLILDEAHSIKQRTTGVAKACFALKGTYKWCLSGTPVQNRIGEFFSLLRFLEVRPFADYFCKKCPCSQLHWSLDEDHKCSHCAHSGAEHVSVFNQELLNPIIQNQDPALRTEALDKLKMITDRIMLRRMKKDHTTSMVSI